ncbi:hypothetical protein [Brevibacterium album]|uniref:hypothetical protein n=1 Tax=Brevibacterium album TaxID=417948 RepID=UPI00041721E5|nr:hypothetical protein [Brevibacterium album]
MSAFAVHSLLPFGKPLKPALLRLLALAMFAQGTSEFVLACLLPGISHDLGVPLGHVSLLTPAFVASMIIGATTMAVISRILSPR